MWCLTLDVPTVGIAQPRHRYGRRNGRVGLYLPEDHPVRAYKAELALRARQAIADMRTAIRANGKDAPDFPFAFPLELRVAFLLPRRNGRGMASTRWHGDRPDADNLVKSFKDALTGIVWEDDCLVAAETVVKAYHGPDGVPRVTATVRPAGDVHAALEGVR